MSDIPISDLYTHAWVQRWEAGVGPQNNGVVNRLTEELVPIFKGSVKYAESLLSPDVQRSLERSYSSLILWVDGYGVTEGKIDDSLKKSRTLQRSIIELLVSISNTLTKRLLPKLAVSSEQIDIWTLQSITLEASSTLQKGYDDDVSDGSDSDVSSNPDTLNDMNEIVDDLETDTQCLMDLDPLITAPAADPKPQLHLIKGGHSVAEQKQSIVEWSPHKLYGDRITFRFPRAEPGLVARLAEANHDRYLRNQAERMANLKDGAENGDMNVGPVQPSEEGTKFQDSGLGTSIRQSSTYAETVMSYHHGEGHAVRIPSMPEEGKQGKAFECLVCGRHVLFSNNSAWKKHIFLDLQPWICLDLACTGKNKSFRSPDEWIYHLSWKHGFAPGWNAVDCPLCCERIAPGKVPILRHLSGHMEVISLDSLPAGLDSEASSDRSDDLEALPVAGDGSLDLEADAEITGGLHGTDGDSGDSESPSLPSLAATSAATGPAPSTRTAAIDASLPQAASAPISAGIEVTKNQQISAANQGRSAPVNNQKSQNTKDGEPLAFVCLYPGCQSKGFRRKADLERHMRNCHLPVEEKESYLCDYRKCPYRDDPFHRRDHFRDHLRDYHKEDIEKRGGSSDKFFEGPNIKDDWWRCPRCLKRNYVSKHGYDCPNCKSQVPVTKESSVPQSAVNSMSAQPVNFEQFLPPGENTALASTERFMSNQLTTFRTSSPGDEPIYDPLPYNTSYIDEASQQMGYSSPAEYPSQVQVLDASGQKTNDGKPAAFICLYPGCQSKGFRRKANLERHMRNCHLPIEEKESYLCDYRKCPRSDDPYHRRDHFRDHLRDYHKEDIEKRGDSSDKFFEDRNIKDDWWRCPRCLKRNYVSKHGYDCPGCKSQLSDRRQKHKSTRH